MSKAVQMLIRSCRRDTPTEHVRVEALAGLVFALVAMAAGCRSPSRVPVAIPTAETRRQARNAARSTAGFDTRNLPPPPDWLKVGVAQARAEVRARPYDAEARRDLGLALYADGLYAEAAREITAFIRLKPGVPQAHYYLGQCYMALRMPEDARFQFLTTLDLDKEAARDAEVLCDLGQACQEAGRLSEANAHFERALGLDPRSYSAEHGLGCVAAARGQNATARRHFERMLAKCARSDRERAGGYAALGKLAMEAGKINEARTEFAKALRLNPANAWARAGLRRLRELHAR